MSTEKVKEVITIDSNQFFNKFINEIINGTGLKPLDFRSFFVKVPDTNVMVSFTRINDKAYFVTVSEDDIVRTVENFADPVLAANNMIFKIKSIQQQVENMKKQAEEKLS